jgi:anthranilate phosphoribosyltransferase
MSDPHPSALAAALQRLAQGEDLDRGDASAAMATIMDGNASPAQIGAFLMGLRQKGETADEITGCAEAIRLRALPVPHRHERLVDTCGTGGDGMATFNISTTAAFIVAGAGQIVAKHGNRAVTSRTGSADVLDALGVQVDMAGPEAAGALDEVGITFLFAPTYHAAMRHAAPVRRELGVRTVFNLLGPLCNPAGATAQIVGVFDGELVPVIANVLGKLGLTRALVVHGSDGLDEITVSGPTRVAEWRDGRVAEYEVSPGDLGLPAGRVEDLRGGDADTNARMLREVLSGTPGAARHVALLNASAALLAAGGAADLREGVQRATESVDSGAALGKLDRLIAYSKSLREREGGKPRTREVVPGIKPGWGRTA